MGIVVTKLVRLGKDGDVFKKDMIAKVERTSMKLEQDYIDEQNKSWKDSGRLYIVDKEATEKRNASLVKETKPDNPNADIRKALKKEADEMGLEYPKNIKTEKLAELISDNK